MSDPVGAWRRMKMDEAIASRRLLTLLLQTATVELFASYGIAEPPVEHIVHQATNDHAATIPFRSQVLKGSLALVAEDQILTIMRPRSSTLGRWPIGRGSYPTS